MEYYVKNTERKGVGLYAKKYIPAFSVISDIKYIREVTKDNPLSESEKHLHDHQHYWPDGRIFIVHEPECYFNHSCNPNAYIYSAAGKYFILAKKDIKSEEEITVDYEIQTTGFDVAWECKCGAINCRGMHTWDIFLLPTKIIRESLPFLDPWFAQVHGDKIREILNQALHG
ncbi:MAG: SET domain-containing protein-lysine N-methyltransferase [bacterium]|nr:SET domain-containing protein-lysine N-methyltransferase [bacterium]